ncbi:MAG: RNA pseudouridine synthase [Flavobacteriales bacterium]|nr:RNA pseudouridine synthase [Flavobacteriales bacterium]
MDVVYEDNHIIAINKKSGILAQGDKTNDKSLIEITKHFLKKKYNKPGNVFVGLPHRIDRPVSGLIVLSKTSKSLTRMSELFREKKIEKIYWVIVKNKLEKKSGKLIHFLKKNKKQNKSYVSEKEKKDYLRSELHYGFLKNLKNYYLYEIKLITGRHHQIRTQLAYIKSPIKGDIKYGAKRTNKYGGICLHSRKISFVHPIKKEIISLQAPLPKKDLWVHCK